MDEDATLTQLVDVQNSPNKTTTNKPKKAQERISVVIQRQLKSLYNSAQLQKQFKTQSKFKSSRYNHRQMRADISKRTQPLLSLCHDDVLHTMLHDSWQCIDMLVLDSVIGTNFAQSSFLSVDYCYNKVGQQYFRGLPYFKTFCGFFI